MREIPIMDSFENLPELKKTAPAQKFPDIADQEEAWQAIEAAIENGEFPVISVPEKFAEAAKNGLKSHATWIPNFETLSGTILRSPYAPRGQKRRFFRVSVPPKQIRPRFTGNDRHWHGVVIFQDPIPPDKIEEIPPDKIEKMRTQNR